MTFLGRSCGAPEEQRCSTKRKGGELVSLPAVPSLIVRLEVDFEAELERARCAQTEHARSESNEVAASSGSGSVIDGARAAVKRRVQQVVRPVVVLPVEQVEEGNLWLEGQTLEFVPERLDAPAQAEVERKEGVIAHLARRSEVKLGSAARGAGEGRRHSAERHKLSLSEEPRVNESLSGRSKLVAEFAAQRLQEVIQVARLDIPAERTDVASRNGLVHCGLPVAKVIKLENVLGIAEGVVVDILRQRPIPVRNHIHSSTEGHIHRHASRELVSSIEAVRPRELSWVALVWSRVDEVSVHGGSLVARQ